MTALQQRVYSRIRHQDPNGCWDWPGAKTLGYGVLHKSGGNAYVHRLVYEWVTGNPIPAGLQIDHLCRNRACANPFHMEIVPPIVNKMRGEWPPAVNARKTECIRGHLFSPENTYVYPRGNRQCRECYRLRKQAKSKKIQIQ